MAMILSSRETKMCKVNTQIFRYGNSRPTGVTMPSACRMIEWMSHNFFRRGIHHFVYGLCAVVIGITPPTEKQEVPFFFILIGFFLFVTVGVYVFAAYVIPAFK